MKELQIALIVFGVALVAAVWFYNRWVERKYRQRAGQSPPRADDDAPKGREEKTEPGLMPPAAGEDGETAVRTLPEARPLPVAEAAVPPEPSFMDADLPLEPEQLSVPAGGEVDLPLDFDELTERNAVPIPDEWGDGRADCLLRIEFAAPVPVPVLWEEHKEWSQGIDKPIQWLGFGDLTGHWRTLLPQDEGKVTQVAVALQLVDRLGAVSEETLRRFIEGVSRLARRFVGKADTPAPGPLLERARELDAFCASVDLQLSLHVLPKNTAHMSGALLRPLIERVGLRLEGERFVAFNADETEAFALICRSMTAFQAERVEAMELIDLMFSLDVPRVADGVRTFDRLIDFARQCAAALGGQLADAHRKPLPDSTVATIRGRIEELQRRMTDRGIPPGSVRALRLFA